VSAGNFDAVEAALEPETACGNAHSATFPADEVRGQLRRTELED
jgi:hypothetical protein